MAPRAALGACAGVVLGQYRVMRSRSWVGVGLVALSAAGGCADSDVTAFGPGPDLGDASVPVGEADASAPHQELDAARDAGDASESLDAASMCGALSEVCPPSAPCEDYAATLATLSGRCSRPPYIRNVTQTSACGWAVVAYRFGASDTSILFFDDSSRELMASWSKSDTGEIQCRGDIDPSCASSLERSLPDTQDCPGDAGAVDASTPDSGS